jgi:ABC-type antimicrobial peptide transport system permease subunit
MIVGTTIRINRLPFMVVGVAPEGFIGTELFYRPPILQVPNNTTTLLVRSTLPASVMVPQMGQAMQALDPALPLYSAQSVQAMLGFALFPSRAAAVALSAFGLVAIVLAATGIHAVIAYAVARRRREIGIRIVMGARRADVLRLVLSRVAAFVGAGSIVGLTLALAAAPLLSQIVYQTSPREPLVLVGVLAIVTLVGLIASWAPAMRSLQTDPIKALRSE